MTIVSESDDDSANSYISSKKSSSKHEILCDVSSFRSSKESPRLKALSLTKSQKIEETSASFSKESCCESNYVSTDDSRVTAVSQTISSRATVLQVSKNKSVRASKVRAHKVNGSAKNCRDANAISYEKKNERDMNKNTHPEIPKQKKDKLQKQKESDSESANVLFADIPTRLEKKISSKKKQGRHKNKNVACLRKDAEQFLGPTDNVESPLLKSKKVERKKKNSQKKKNALTKVTEMEKAALSGNKSKTSSDVQAKKGDWRSNSEKRYVGLLNKVKDEKKCEAPTRRRSEKSDVVTKERATFEGMQHNKQIVKSCREDGNNYKKISPILSIIPAAKSSQAIKRNGERSRSINADKEELVRNFFPAKSDLKQCGYENTGRASITAEILGGNVTVDAINKSDVKKQSKKPKHANKKLELSRIASSGLVVTRRSTRLIGKHVSYLEDFRYDDEIDTNYIPSQQKDDSLTAENIEEKCDLSLCCYDWFYESRSPSLIPEEPSEYIGSKTVRKDEKKARENKKISESDSKECNEETRIDKEDYDSYFGLFYDDCIRDNY